METRTVRVNRQEIDNPSNVFLTKPSIFFDDPVLCFKGLLMSGIDSLPLMLVLMESNQTVGFSSQFTVSASNQH